MSYKSIIGAYSSNNVRESFHTMGDVEKTQKQIHDENRHAFMVDGGGFSPYNDKLCHYVITEGGVQLAKPKLICHPLLISPGHVNKYLRVGRFIDSNNNMHDKYILGNINDFRGLISKDCHDITDGGTGTQYTETTSSDQCVTSTTSSTSTTSESKT